MLPPRFALLALGLCLVTACSGSSFNVTSADEAVGRAPSAEERSEETVAVETGTIELSECPDNATWTERVRPDDRYAVNYPSNWNFTDTERGLSLTHPKGWLSVELAVHAAETPTQAVVALRREHFAGAEVLSKFDSKAHPAGRASDGILRLDGRMLIVRYLISDTHFLEATVETDRPLNEDCRQHVLALVKSVQLLDPNAEAKAKAEPPSPAPEKAPAPPPDAVPLDLHPTRSGSEPAPSDLDAAAGVTATKEQGVDEQRVELP